MTNPQDPDEEERSTAALRHLLKRSLSEEAIAKDPPDLLPGVQRRIRKRSRGKFFADGWSTTQTRASYVLIGITTLLLVVLAYWMLSPIGMR
jgi:hypothetical protein